MADGIAAQWDKPASFGKKSTPCGSESSWLTRNDTESRERHARRTKCKVIISKQSESWIQLGVTVVCRVRDAALYPAAGFVSIKASIVVYTLERPRQTWTNVAAVFSVCLLVCSANEWSMKRAYERVLCRAECVQFSCFCLNTDTCVCVCECHYNACVSVHCTGACIKTPVDHCSKGKHAWVNNDRPAVEYKLLLCSVYETETKTDRVASLKVIPLKYVLRWKQVWSVSTRDTDILTLYGQLFLCSLWRLCNRKCYL